MLGSDGKPVYNETNSTDYRAGEILLNDQQVQTAVDVFANYGQK